MKYAVKPIEIAPAVWLGVDGYGGWRLFYESRKPEDEWLLGQVAQDILDFVALVLNSAEAVEVVVCGRLCGVAPSIEQYNGHAVQKLIDRANELWTFEVEK